MCCATELKNTFTKIVIYQQTVDYYVQNSVANHATDCRVVQKYVFHQTSYNIKQESRAKEICENWPFRDELGMVIETPATLLFCTYTSEVT